MWEKSIPQLVAALESGMVTSEALVDQYLERIEAFERHGPALNALITINPEAKAVAAALDAERARGGARGPLHGIPVIVKDNYDTGDMPTTAGAVALAASIPPDDAFHVRKLRDAGAIVLAKANMHEFAYGMTTISSFGGQTRNPYDPTRNPGGSSGGTGAAIAGVPDRDVLAIDLHGARARGTGPIVLQLSGRGRGRVAGRVRLGHRELRLLREGRLYADVRTIDQVTGAVRFNLTLPLHDTRRLRTNSE